MKAIKAVLVAALCVAPVLASAQENSIPVVQTSGATLRVRVVHCDPSESLPCHSIPVRLSQSGVPVRVSDDGIPVQIVGDAIHAEPEQPAKAQ